MTTYSDPRMTSPRELLSQSRSVLVIDWPSRDVPESLVRAGLSVTVRYGPGPNDFAVHELSGGEIVVRPAKSPPRQVDLVYVYRPPGELPDVIARALELGAKAIWIQSGYSAENLRDPTGCWMSDSLTREVRRQIEAAGLICLTEPYIGAVARG